MSQFDKRLDKLFDVAPVEEIEQEFIPATIPEKSNDLQNLLSHDLNQDYELARDNINNVLQKGMEAIDDMLSIARQSEKARDFEVAGNLMKQLVENSKELLNIQKEMRNITGQKESSTTNIKNAVFVGSTTELLKTMKELKMRED